MSRTFVALLALMTALGLTAAVPTAARADTPFGLRIDVGNSSFRYNQGYYGPGYYGRSYYGPSYGSYYRDRYDRHGHYGHYHRPYRPTVVIPEYYHWTPGRGYHSHGQILVPHRGHYDAYRY